MAQISLAKSSCKFALNGLKNWMKPEKVSIYYLFI
jgi:aldehyde dehydrogenase (NAD+)